MAELASTHAESLIPLPVGDVSTEHILAALQPIWLTKAQTALNRPRLSEALTPERKGLR